MRHAVQELRVKFVVNVEQNHRRKRLRFPRIKHLADGIFFISQKIPLNLLCWQLVRGP